MGMVTHNPACFTKYRRVVHVRIYTTEAVNAAIFSFHQHSGPLRNVAATKKKKILIHGSLDPCFGITQDHQTLFSPLTADLLPLEATFF
jgi:hypothetical protein